MKKRCPYCMDGIYASPLTNWDGMRCDRCDGTGWVAVEDAPKPAPKPLIDREAVAAMRAQLAALRGVS